MILGLSVVLNYLFVMPYLNCILMQRHRPLGHFNIFRRPHLSLFLHMLSPVLCHHQPIVVVAREDAEWQIHVL
jgi:hypothetical protein